MTYKNLIMLKLNYIPSFFFSNYKKFLFFKKLEYTSHLPWYIHIDAFNVIAIKKTNERFNYNSIVNKKSRYWKLKKDLLIEIFATHKKKKKLKHA